jgi:hypothetical protein
VADVQVSSPWTKETKFTIARHALNAQSDSRMSAVCCLFSFQGRVYYSKEREDVFGMQIGERPREMHSQGWTCFCFAFYFQWFHGFISLF